MGDLHASHMAEVPICHLGAKCQRIVFEKIFENTFMPNPLHASFANRVDRLTQTKWSGNSFLPGGKEVSIKEDTSAVARISPQKDNSE